MDRQRIDKWLWHARVVRARAAASALVSSGRIRLNGARISTPGHTIRIGDVLTIALDQRVRLWKVAGFSERRGDASAARLLYIDLEEQPSPAGPRD